MNKPWKDGYLITIKLDALQIHFDFGRWKAARIANFHIRKIISAN